MPISFACPHCGHRTNVSAEFAGMTGPCANCGKQITIPLVPGMSPEEGLAAEPVGSGRSALTWILFLVAGLGFVSCILCMGVGVMLPAVQAAREAARRAQCRNNLQLIGIALNQYVADYGSFPPAFVADQNGTRLHSWRVLLLPYIDDELADEYDYDQPWDSPHNMNIATRMPSAYACPSDPDAIGGFTSYMACNGPNRVFQDAKPVKPNAITDGLTRAIAVIESANSQALWLDPNDGAAGAAGMQPDPVAGSNHPGGANVLFADGHVEFLDDDIDPLVLEELELINDGGQGEAALGEPFEEDSAMDSQTESEPAEATEGEPAEPAEAASEAASESASTPDEAETPESTP